MTTNKRPLLRAENISKSFPGVKALSHVDLDLYPGEVHILAGENGAGKSTLIKCILGAYQPDEGKLFLEGREIRLRSPKEGIEHGIAAVYQELTMIPWLDGAQNIFFGREPKIAGSTIINRKKMFDQAKSLLVELGCQEIDLTLPVKKLGIAEQQMIEIAKAISMNPKVIIFDEPTASLSDREVDRLFAQIEILKKKGLAIVYISHRMKELHEVGDRITVLRDGKKIGSYPERELSDDQLVSLMIGGNIEEVYKKTSVPGRETALEIRELSDRKGRVQGCSLQVRKGEIVGLAGLVGAGRTELSRLIFGIDKSSCGQVLLHGEDVTGKSPEYLVDHGLGLLPEDRKGLGLALRAPISWNVVASGLRQIFPHFFMNEKKNNSVAADYIRMLEVATPDVRRNVGQLSGGNQQKVVVAKWLCANTDVILFDEPTRGIDVGAKAEIYALMNKMASEGKAILMISSELPEIMGMSDKIYVMREGRIVGSLERGNFSEDEIGRMMLLSGEGEGA